MNVSRAEKQYVTIKRNRLVLIDGRIEIWPPKHVDNVSSYNEKRKIRDQYLNMLFEIRSVIRKRTRIKLFGEMLWNGKDLKPVIVQAWLGDLVFLNKKSASHF
jgi:hypothetical protein